MTGNSLEEKINEQLQAVKFPGIDRDIVSLGFVDRVDIEGEKARIKLSPTTKKEEHIKKLNTEIKSKVEGLNGVKEVDIEVEAPDRGRGKKEQPQPQPLAGVDEVIAVASGKGGVGKSTVAVNLAASLAEQGYETGFADMDLYGPSAPTVFGLHDRPQVTADEQIVPLDYKGIQVISIGFVLPADQATIWRGPMVSQGVEQLLNDVAWDDLDYLVLDLPPGTGDTQITLSQKIKMSGAVLVTTPQKIAVDDVRRAHQMFEKMGVNSRGIIENMSKYICPECGAERHIFGRGGGKKLADDLDVPFLGGIPMSENIQETTDEGTPIVLADPDSEAARSFNSIAKKLSG